MTLPSAVSNSRRRKTTNRLRAIETSFQSRFAWLRDFVARQLIAFGRLKPMSAGTNQLRVTTGRKTTNRLRAIETAGPAGDLGGRRESQDN